MAYTMQMHTCARAQADAERAIGYWDEPEDPERPPMPEPPEGATHALWSKRFTEWYFWRVASGRYHYHDYVTWVDHKRQDLACQKLKNQLKDGTAFRLADYEPEQHEEGNCTMNLENAALLVRDDITTAQVTFGDGHEFTYILHSSIPAKPGDRVLVPAKDNLKVARIVKVDQETQINVNSTTRYKWVVCNVEEHLNAVETEQEATDTIARALKQRQSANVREQILQQFGVASHSELLALGRDNSQGG